MKDYYNGWNDEGNLEPMKKCPFCGGNGELKDNGYEHPVIDGNGAYVDMDIFEGDTFWIECEKCGAMNTGSDSPEEAIKNWNRRSEEENNWIPCSERLPDPNTEVMCCYDNGELDMMWQDWKSRGKNGLIYGDIDGTTHKVVAWRPLPEPYRPERSDNHDGE